MRSRTAMHMKIVGSLAWSARLDRRLSGTLGIWITMVIEISVPGEE